MANFTPQEIEEMLREFFDVVGKRQYIGARYVPIFGRKNEQSIEWDNSAPYEPLTIVLYQGNSYTSRQYVPIGVEISDNAYWANTGNYNAQIEQYRQDVSNVATRVDSAENDITNLENLVPSNSFDSVNTVKKYIDDKTSNKVIYFDTVANMCASSDLYDGAVCKTLGYYAVNDGGAATYVASDSGTPNGMDILQCQNSLIATLVIEGEGNPLKYGAKIGTNFDSSAHIQRCINENMKTVFAKGGSYALNNVHLQNRRTIDFANCTLYYNGSDNGYMFTAITDDLKVTINLFDADVTLNNGSFLKMVNCYFVDINKIRCRGVDLNSTKPIIHFIDCFNVIFRSVEIAGNANSEGGIFVEYGGGHAGTGNVTNIGFYDCLVQSFINGEAYKVYREVEGAADTIMFENCGCSNSAIAYSLHGYIYASSINASRAENCKKAISVSRSVHINISNFMCVGASYTSPDYRSVLNCEGVDCTVIFTGVLRIIGSQNNEVNFFYNMEGLCDLSNCSIHETYISLDSLGTMNGTVYPSENDAISVYDSTATNAGLFNTIRLKKWIVNQYVIISNITSLKLFKGSKLMVLNTRGSDYTLKDTNDNTIGMCVNDQWCTFMYNGTTWNRIA